MNEEPAYVTLAIVFLDPLSGMPLGVTAFGFAQSPSGSFLPVGVATSLHAALDFGPVAERIYRRGIP